MSKVELPKDEIGPQIVCDPFLVPSGHLAGSIPAKSPQYFDHILRNMPRTPLLHVASQSFVGPNGEILSRGSRPSSYAVNNSNRDVLINLPETPDCSTSPFWHTNIDQNNHPSLESVKRGNGHVEVEIARAFLNRAPVLECQELLVLPRTSATSISQVGDIELLALSKLMKSRYLQRSKEGFGNIFFTFHFGEHGGGSSDHFHIQLCASREVPGTARTILENEVLSGISHYEFLRQSGRLVIENDVELETESFVPLTARNPYTIEVALVKAKNAEGGKDSEHRGFGELSHDDLLGLLKSLRHAVTCFETLPKDSPALGLPSYSVCINTNDEQTSLSPAGARLIPKMKNSEAADHSLGGSYSELPAEISCAVLRHRFSIVDKQERSIYRDLVGIQIK